MTVPTRTPGAAVAVLLFLTIASAFFAEATAQPMQSGLPMDSVDLRYRLRPGDRSLYRVVSFDTIYIYGEPRHQLLRERVDLVEYRCDSVLADTYIMTVTLKEYIATERFDTLPPMRRERNEWVGRPVSFLMTFTGKRIRLFASPDTPATASGGPFQPLIVPYLGEEEAYVGSSRTFDSKQWLLDNAYPPVWSDGTVFRAVVKRHDTLGAKVLAVSMSEIARGTHEAPGGMKTTATINGGGDYHLPVTGGLPVAGRYSISTNMLMTAPNGSSRDGRQSLIMIFQDVTAQEAGRGREANRGGAK